MLPTLTWPKKLLSFCLTIEHYFVDSLRHLLKIYSDSTVWIIRDSKGAILNSLYLLFLLQQVELSLVSDIWYYDSDTYVQPASLVTSGLKLQFYRHRHVLRALAAIALGESWNYWHEKKCMRCLLCCADVPVFGLPVITSNNVKICIMFKNISFNISNLLASPCIVFSVFSISLFFRSSTI